MPNSRSLDDQYNPFSCLTAQELRFVGIAVPEEIPNCAWIPRHSLRFTVTSVKQEGDVIHTTTEVTIDAAFRWISAELDLNGHNSLR